MNPEQKKWAKVTQVADGRRLLAYFCADCKERGRPRGWEGTIIVPGGLNFDWAKWIGNEYECPVCDSRNIQLHIANA